MTRKLALAISALGLSIPVATALAASPALAATRTHSSSVDKPHTEGSKKDTSVDKTNHEKTETEDAPSPDRTPSTPDR